MYSKLMARIHDSQQVKRPPIPAEVMAEVSTKLVAFMHEVTSASENDEPQPSLVRKTGPPSRRSSSKRAEAADISKSVEALAASEAVDVWHGAHRGHVNSHPRRGSLGQVSGSSSASEANLGGLGDDERWSWKGSFESTIAMTPKKEETASRPVTSARFKPAMVVEANDLHERPRNYSTSSLPRLGTSAIKKQPPVTIETSEATLELSTSVHKKNNVMTSTTAVPRSARYRPHGYRPPPTRKPSSPSSRKSSVDSVSRYTGRKIHRFLRFHIYLA